MIRLLMLSFNRVGKGTYWRAFGFGQELARRGHDVTLLAVSSQQKRRFDERNAGGVRLVETPDLHPSSGYDLWDTLARITWLRGRQFDLVHAFEARPVVIGPSLYLRRFRGTPLVMDWCDWFGAGGSVEERSNPVVRTLLRPVETFFEERFRRYATGTTVINSILRERAIELGIPSGQILLLPNGANVTEIRPQKERDVRRRLALPEDAPIIAYTGAIFRRDAALMAAAFDQIQQQRPEARLLLIGYCNIAVEKLVQNPAAVIRTGPVTFAQLADYVAACDIGWLPLQNSDANRGRFPMKINDFMAAGRPLIVTDVGDMGKLVQVKGIGCVTADRPESLAQAVLDLLAKTDVRAEMGQRARRIAEDEFAWPRVTDQLESFYRQVLNSNNHEPFHRV